MLNCQVNQAHRLGAERGRHRISAVGRDSHRAHRAIGNVDAVADLGGGNVQGVKGERGAKVEIGVVGADGGRRGDALQVEGAQHVAKGDAAGNHVNFVDGA